MSPSSKSETFLEVDGFEVRISHPDKVVFRDELPTNATGKVLRRELVSELNASKEPA